MIDLQGCKELDITEWVTPPDVKDIDQVLIDNHHWPFFLGNWLWKTAFGVLKVYLGQNGGGDPQDLVAGWCFSKVE